MKISKKRLVLAGFALGLLFTSIGLPAIAQTRSGVRQGLPGRRISGGARDMCSSEQSVVALTPSDDLDASVSDRSSLKFLLPEFDQAYPVEFKLRDSQGATVYTEALSTGEKEKLVSIQVPEESLQADQSYRWYFSVVCDAQDRSQNIVLWGQLQPAHDLMNSHREDTAAEPAVTKHAAR